MENLSIGVKNGLLMGAAYCFFTVLCYLVEPKYLFNFVAIFSFVIILFYMIRAAKEEKYMQENAISFVEVLKPTFLAYIIGSGLYTIFMFLLLSWDQSLLETGNEVFGEMLDKIKLYTDETFVEDLKKELEREKVDIFTPNTIIIQFFSNLIFPGIVFSITIAAVLKNEK